MEFTLNTAFPILNRTPIVLSMMLGELPEEWTHANEGGDSWSPFDIVGHYIHGEKTDWIPRANIILSDAADKTFPPFDRFAQFENSKGKSMDELLDEFTELRSANLGHLLDIDLTPENLARTGIHPEFGEVTLSELLSTWVTHDLVHLAQLARVMAKQNAEAVGPWKAYIPLLQS